MLLSHPKVEVCPEPLSALRLAADAHQHPCGKAASWVVLKCGHIIMSQEATGGRSGISLLACSV